ncbi:MAG: MBL fold metallo-hydrolase [Pseudomonadota bacterium]
MKQRLIPFVGVCVALMLLCSALVRTSSSERVQETGATKLDQYPADIVVTVLGSGTPAPSATQFGPSILVQAANQNLIFDCGRGCTARLAQVDPKLIGKVDRLFISHLHSDHIVGIPDLWLNGWTQGRLQPLKVFGPTGSRDMMQHFRRAFEFDIDIRFSHNAPGSLEGLVDDILELSETGVIYEQDGLEVTAFLVDHSVIKPAWGFRVDYNGRSVMISGDTRPTENLYRYGKNADLILQEVMSPALIEYLNTLFSEKQAAWIVATHTTAEQAADIFAQSEPGLAVYYHTRNDGQFAQSLIEKTREGYSGPLAISHDLFQIRVGEEITTHDLRLEAEISR